MNVNDPADGPPMIPAAEAAAGALTEARSLVQQVEDLIRRHPLASGLTAMGLGCAVGMAIHELLTPAPPPTAKQRALNLLEDIQCRLAELMEPVGDHVSQLAEDGVSAVKSGLHSMAHSRAAGRFRNLLS
jgi:hypothetical protein